MDNTLTELEKDTLRMLLAQHWKTLDDNRKYAEKVKDIEGPTFEVPNQPIYDFIEALLRKAREETVRELFTKEELQFIYERLPVLYEETGGSLEAQDKQKLKKYLIIDWLSIWRKVRKELEKLRTIASEKPKYEMPMQDETMETLDKLSIKPE